MIMALGVEIALSVTFVALPENIVSILSGERDHTPCSGVTVIIISLQVW